MSPPGGGRILNLGSRSPAASSNKGGSPRANSTSTCTSSSSTTPNITTRYRRNGKLQSCEPCRKSKLRCDHSLPTCGRCVRRRCAELCTYHPAPMTNPTVRHRLPSPSPQRSTDSRRPPSARDASSPRPSTAAWSHHRPEQSPLAKDPFNTFNSNVPLPPPVATTASSSPSLLSSRPRQSHPTSATGKNTISSPVNQDYMGATSFSSIFSESLPKYGLAAELQCLRQFSVNPHEGKNILPPHQDPVMIEQGSRVLALFQDRNLINTLIDRLLEIANGSGDIFPASIIHGWLEGLWSVHSQTLESQDPAAIQDLCVLLWRNTSTQMSYNGETTPEQWMRAATGHNIRWEVLGILLSLTGDCCTSLTSADPIFSPQLSRLDPMVRLSRAARLCLAFCQEISAAMDDLLLFLARQIYNITVSTSSPSSFEAYQASGTILNALIAMGLHEPEAPGSERHVPFFLAELRKRTFASSFAQEVGLATFLGRPPRLSYRYCRFKPASGLTNEEILLPTRERTELLTRLDAHGFRKDGVMNEQAFRKIWWTLTPRREDILDLSLGQYTPEEVLRRADDIERQMEDLWAILPQSMRDARDGPVGYDKLSPFERLLHDLCRESFRASSLLLQRILFQQVPGMSSDRLLQKAHEFLDDMLCAAKRPEMATTYRADAISQLVFHGMRCAAILAVELLRREQMGSSSTNSTGDSGSSGLGSAFSRGKTIRLLSVFVSQLSVVEVGEMWYHNCEQGTNLIGRILDRILDPQAVPTSVVTQQSHAPSLATLAGVAEQHGARVPSNAVEGVTTSDGPGTATINSGKDNVYRHNNPQAPYQNQHQPDVSHSGLSQQQYSNFSMPPDIGPSGDLSSWEWAVDFPLDVPLLGNDADLMQWYQAQGTY
ncbi:chromatin structure-remodeling complex subunit RSC3/30 [Microdochium nivale]|nr:chromatin structure-remodeling complex subunit RSC3/30 [Microdochium nivale]